MIRDQRQRRCAKLEMLGWLLLWLLITIGVFWSATARAGDIFLYPLSAEQTTTPCPRTTTTSSNHPFDALNCSSSGTPAFVFHINFPRSAGTSWQATTYSKSADTSSNNHCWTIETAHLGDLSAWNTATTFGSAVNITVPQLSANTQLQGTSVTFTPFSSSFGTTCDPASICQLDPLVVRVKRNNGCSSPVTGDLEFLGLRLTY